jgi:hypothetical protein
VSKKDKYKLSGIAQHINLSACHQKQLLPRSGRGRLTNENEQGQWEKSYWLFSFAAELESQITGPHWGQSVLLA